MSVVLKVLVAFVIPMWVVEASGEQPCGAFHREEDAVSPGSQKRVFPSPAVCVRACPDGASSPKRLWNGISPQVKAWELGKRAEALKWFEENQFGKTPCGRLPDQVIGESSVSFTNAGIRIEIYCRLPEGADAAHPAPVFLFGDHCGGKRPPEYAQETYEGIPTNSIAARGYAYVRWNFNDVCPNVDRGNSLFRWPVGVISHLATGDRNATNVVRSADSWGTIGAWAWGNSRVMDWIESRPELDSTRVAVLGHSRGGKTALWTGAQDERFALTISNGSGCGGARLGRAKDPKAESFRQILHNFPNWFCPAMTEWIDRDSEIPHDADDLIRLIAPRLVYVASGSEDAWAGPAAEKAAWDAAHDIYRAYGIEERMGYHCHDGIHKLCPDDWERFMDFADCRLKAPSSADSDVIARRIAAACADGSRTVTLVKNGASPDGVWRLTRAILLPDDFTFVFDGCRVELVDGTQDNLVRNAGAAEGACVPNRGIRILGRNGAVLSGGRRNHYLPRRSGDPNGWRSVGILLCDVSDYEIGGFAMEETQCWAISQERCCRGRVHDIVFGSTDILFNQDGIDVRKGCHDLVIENISGSVGDDAVALTAYRDPPGAPVRYGMQIGGNATLGESDDVHGVTVRNIRARSAGGHGVIRLLVCDGIRMHHVTVENVVDTATGDQRRPQATVRIGDVHFYKTRRCEMGEMHHIAVRDVKASGKVAVWIKGPLRDSEIVSIAEAPGGRKYDITAPIENVALDVFAEPARRPLLIYNGDSDEAYRDRFHADPDHYTEEEFRKYLSEIIDSGTVTHFFICLNARVANFPSKTVSPYWACLDDPTMDHPRWIRAAKEFAVGQGKDKNAISIDMCRARKVSPWISIRMNDVHATHDPKFFANVGFWKDHPEFWRVPHAKCRDWREWEDRAFDYSHPEVRQWILAFIAEALERYDADGVEIDWMRFPCHLPKGRERELSGSLDEVMRQVRRLADAAAKRRGHPVGVAARVDSDPVAAFNRGTDYRTWAKEGLVDWLIPCNFFGSADFELPYAKWADELRRLNPSVTVVPGLDVWVCIGNDRRALTSDEYCGWGERMYAQGAPGAYLFNFTTFHPVSGPTDVWKVVIGQGFTPDAIKAHARSIPAGAWRECTPWLTPSP